MKPQPGTNLLPQEGPQLEDSWLGLATQGQGGVQEQGHSFMGLDAFSWATQPILIVNQYLMFD